MHIISLNAVETNNSKPPRKLFQAISLNIPLYRMHVSGLDLQV